MLRFQPNFFVFVAFFMACRVLRPNLIEMDLSDMYIGAACIPHPAICAMGTSFEPHTPAVYIV